MEDPRSLAERIIANVERVIVGKSRELRLAVTALLCQGHCLIEDVPGVGKTMLARSLARSTGCTFRRIQFTPDLLPGDVTGVSIFNQKTSDFEFRPGPILAQVVLADEINRATPRTQSALLEAMEERQVTVDGVTHPLPQPFMVLATQNPVEHEGTFPLPESQLDRFMLRIGLGYGTIEEEMEVLSRQQLRHPLQSLSQVAAVEELRAAQEAVRNLHLSIPVKRYIVELCHRTRKHPSVQLGASPRGSLTLHRAGQALAALAGRDYVLPDDVKVLAVPALAHRLILAPSARLHNVSADSIVEEILKEHPVPTGDFKT